MYKFYVVFEENRLIVVKNYFSWTFVETGDLQRNDELEGLILKFR